jgi:hypothetical protein
MRRNNDVVEQRNPTCACRLAPLRACWIAAALLTSAALHPAQAQTVSINNTSYPATSLEVGDNYSVVISGATPYGAVTLIANGGSPYLFGYTDGSGNFSVTGTIVSAVVGAWTEYWYVNGVALTAANPDTYWLPHAPTLPVF